MDMMSPQVMDIVAYEDEAPKSVLQQQESGLETSKEPAFSPSNEQNALLSLTLNEIQLKRGKSLGSMNMDEFLSNLWTDELQTPSQQPNQLEVPEESKIKTTENNHALARQGSFSIPAMLCKKTVDEVWFEIAKDLSLSQSVDHEGECNQLPQPPQRQQTLGEMTLEDFLVKAGVINGASRMALHKRMGSSAASGLNAFMDASVAGGAQAVGSSLLVGNANVAGYEMLQYCKGLFGEVTDDCKEKDQGMAEMVEQHNKRRAMDGLPEVVVERRQRRMIKNRESAARSRARKQAYTVELELELNQLKEENAKLKQTMADINQKRQEQLLKRKMPSTLSQKRANQLRMLRRAVSLSW